MRSTNGIQTPNKAEFERPISARNKINRSIGITGVARSGTTIVGKIVHSLESVEYFFEPPMLIPILLECDNLASGRQRFMIESYLYDELFIGALAGRTINTNLYDDSSIYKVKPKAQIEDKLSRTYNRSELDAMSNNGVLAFKSPASSVLMSKLIDLYSGMKVIYIHRRPVEVINSLMNKGWFKSKQASESVMWPWKRIGNVTVPWWVPDLFANDYSSLSEIDRCAYYYLVHTHAAENDDRFYWLYYDDLIDSTKQFVESLCEITDLSVGSKTESIIGYVKRSEINRDLNVLDKVSREFNDVFHY